MRHKISKTADVSFKLSICKPDNLAQNYDGIVLFFSQT